jgi:hypothetical protein
MLAAEFIVFATLFAIPIIWTFLKILVNHLVDADLPEEKADPLRKAA